MNKIHSAILVSMMLGGALIVFVVSLIPPQEMVFANTPPDLSDDLPNTDKADAIQYSAGLPPEFEEQPAVQVTLVEDLSVPVGCSISSMYPEDIRQWCELVIQVAENYDMDANLIAAVMLQESGGNPRAYSKSGAVGLLQVMPKDGIAASFTCINGPCFANRPSSEELFDPAFNLQYGVRMLAGLLTRYGNIRDALKAYGPMDMGYHYADKVLSIYQNYQ
jgi:hypothetical protein